MELSLLVVSTKNMVNIKLTITVAEEGIQSVTETSNKSDDLACRMGSCGMV